MYYKDKATTAESEVQLLRVLASTLNTQNDTLANEVRKARLDQARAELQNGELKEKIGKRNKALVVVAIINLALLTLLYIR